jgi:hypothetical protein
VYVEILCPRCLAAVSGSTLRGRSLRSSPAPIDEPLSSSNLIDDEDSLTETDIVEAELTIADDPPKSG